MEMLPEASILRSDGSIAASFAVYKTEDGALTVKPCKTYEALLAAKGGARVDSALGAAMQRCADLHHVQLHMQYEEHMQMSFFEARVNVADYSIALC